MIAGACWPCICGLHEECYALQETLIDGMFNCCCFGHTGDDAAIWAVEVGRPVSNPGDIDDVLSTGRKRVAMLYPVYDEMVCEWAGLRFAGGGIKPIIGCQGNLLYEERGKYARHHGPDKNVLENNPGNVHRICYTCHNRWHALNNEFYGIRPEHGQPFLPLEGEMLRHDPDTKASEEELEANEIWWSKKKIERVLDED